jgi:hypothetical protein
MSIYGINHRTSYKELFMSSVGLGTKNGCAGEDQQPKKSRIME